MSCGVADIELRFEKSGIVIQPRQLNLRKNNGEFNHVRTRISREAGILVHENHISLEPVTIVSNDEVLARMYISDSDNAIEVTEKSAFLNLRDELQIFDRTIIDKSFSGSWMVEDIIEWLVNKAQENDKQGVITGWEFTEENLLEDTAYTIAGSYDNDLGIIAVAKETISEAFTKHISPVDDINLDYENVSVWKALADISNKLEISMFGRDEGILYVGEENHEHDIYGAGYLDRMMNMTGISLPEFPKKVRSVHVNGGRVTYGDELPWGVAFEDSLLKTQATAFNPNEPDGEDYVVDAKEISNLNTLEGIAERVLRNKSRSDNSGTVTVDVLSTNVEANPKSMSLGDYVYIPEHSFCSRYIPDGLFYISGIHHKINNRVGWSSTLDISHVVTDTIETTSTNFDASDSAFLDQLEGGWP